MEVINIGVVIIGRNEGERLKRSLQSVMGVGQRIVYVDSGSQDGSVEWCMAQRVQVVELDTSLPFTAARGRNAGLKRLRELEPQLRYVQFVDGDCELNPAWLKAAAESLDQNPKLAAVCGRLNEAHPKLSIYNQMCDLQWADQIGEIESCGGLFMARLTALNHVGDFNPNIRGGEEPELCRRLRDDGWTIERIDTPMAIHDAVMLTFKQWCKRQTRSAYGALEVYTCYRVDQYRRSLHSAWWWGLGWPAVLTLAAVMAGPVGALCILWVLLLQMARVTHRMKKRGCQLHIAATYGVLVMISKWPQLWGQWLYLLDRRRQCHTRRIDYKQEPAAH